MLTRFSKPRITEYVFSDKSTRKYHIEKRLLGFLWWKTASKGKAQLTVLLIFNSYKEAITYLDNFFKKFNTIKVIRKNILWRWKDGFGR